MYLRIDRLQVELPEPRDPDPNAAAAVQELLGGRFGEMSTVMNYTYQSFNFRGRRKLKPYYDLVANIATEELGHIELVAAVINGLLTGASERTELGDAAGGVREAARRITGDGASAPMAGAKDARNTHHFIAHGQTAMVANSMGQPWQGDYVFNSGDLVLDMLHNFFLESGARLQKIRVYEMTDHPIARRMLGYLLNRGGVHALAYGKALDTLTGVEVWKLLPIPKVDNSAFPEAREFEDAGVHRKLYRFSPEDYRDIATIWAGTHPDDGQDLEVVDGPPEGGEQYDPPEEPQTFAPGYHPEELQEIAQRLLQRT